MFIRATATLLTTLLAALAPNATASAQMMMPDYSHFYRAIEQQSAAIAQAQQAQLQQVMQYPEVQAMYQQHLAQGGQLSLDQFAYQWAMTAGFTPQGIQNYQRGQAERDAQLRRGWAGVQQAEQNTANAMREWNAGHARNSQEFGNVLSGNSTWTNPTDGSQAVLPYLGPRGHVTDPASGANYYRMPNGQYYMQGPGGYWTPMQQ